jgi:GR25 family glycosyltransferase involved in LPS biosynthesis
MNRVAIPTYIINLKSRIDRRENILKEFAGRNEFLINMINAYEHEVGAMGLWYTIKHILQNLVRQNEEYIIICEDDHQFTQKYDPQFLHSRILEAQKQGADILLGGVSGLGSAVQISTHLFGVGGFTGLQFSVIYRKFFKVILQAGFDIGDNADYKISDLSDNKFVVYPPISTQKEFGYSDVTLRNNAKGHVSRLFKNSSTMMRQLTKIKKFYRRHPVSRELQEYDDITIPTYIINLPERTDRREHIQKQFKNKQEFDVTLVDACKHDIGAVGLWYSIRKIVQMAIANEDDVIIICEDDHEFTGTYSKEFLLRNIIEAHQQCVDILSGGIGGGFSHALYISKNRFWINHFFSTQFLVIYSKFFKKILDEPFDNQVTADDFLSALTSNKMVLYPFISIQKDFGYSDVTSSNNQNKGTVATLFKDGETKLGLYQKAHEKYLCNTP